MSTFNLGGFGGNLGQTERKTGTLFGNTTGPPGGLFNQQQQTTTSQTTPSLFSSSTAPQTNTSLFNSSQQQNTGPSLFGASQQQNPTNSLLGASQQQNTGTSLFGASQQQQQQQQQQTSFGNSIFGGSLQPAPSLTPSQQQQVLQQKHGLPQLRQSSNAPFASSSMTGAREKNVLQQMQLLWKKWTPEEPECAFQYYFYNAVKPDEAMFYGPQPHEDEKKWEEALNKKPSENTIPVLASGFGAIAGRIQMQKMAVTALQTRLHEINNSLQLMKDNHELSFASRITEAKRKHIVFTQRTLALATKVQILRNRGYVMDQQEEELKKKLSELERKTFDPVLGGRQEEIWARMSGVRERARILQEETEKLGKAVDAQQTGELLSAEDQKQLEKLLKDYDKQLEHLKKWVDDTKQEYEEWDKEKRLTKSVSGR